MRQVTAARLCRFRDFQKTEHICRVKDYSRTGVSFFLEDGSLLLHIGDIITDLKFYSNDQEVHAGSATIIHLQDEERGWSNHIMHRLLI